MNQLKKLFDKVEELKKQQEEHALDYSKLSADTLKALEAATDASGKTDLSQLTWEQLDELRRTLEK